MARPRKHVDPPKEVVAVTPPPAPEAPVIDEAPPIAAIEIHAVVPDAAESAPADANFVDDGLVDVRYFDHSTFTFDLHVAKGIAKFVDGVARVTPALAKELREGGYVAEEA